MKNHWRTYQNRWHLLSAPLRPDEEVIQTVTRAVGGQNSSVLLLGVTPELVDAFEHLEAVDKSAEMIAKLWRPRAPTQTVRQADWLNMGDDFGPYSAVVGDCSPNVLQSLEEIDSLMGMVARHMAPGGIFSCRVFERPDEPIFEEDLERIIETGVHGNFHAFKWQIAMSLAAAAAGPTVPVVDILAYFDHLHPDRGLLAQRTGWDRNVINTIDVYRGSSMAVTFPDRSEFDALLSKHFISRGWLQSGTYDLAERCPIFTASNR